MDKFPEYPTKYDGIPRQFTPPYIFPATALMGCIRIWHWVGVYRGVLVGVGVRRNVRVSSYVR